mmetsp:Transcript_38864/g.82675  ORF Transcript_38864/g.82675 Transcript_38864/m.82675 type:complete len:1093 (+) Transcript_38864:43-3321(+)
MSAAATQPRTTKVAFRWCHENVDQSCHVRVVGSATALGAWNPAEGVELVRNAADPACWSSKGIPVPLGVPVQYKYVICSNDGTVMHWESLEGNREVSPTGRKHVLEDDDGRLRKQDIGCWPRQVSGCSVDLEDELRSPSPELASPKHSRSRPSAHSIDTSVLDTLPEELGAKKGRRRSNHGKMLVTEEDPLLTPDDTIFAVFRSLPFRLKRDDTGAWQVEEAEKITFKVVSLLQQCLKERFQEQGAEEALNITFVGDPGVRTSDPEERRQITELLAPYSCLPVFIDEVVAEQHLKFCHSFLWPVMHNMKVFDDDTTLVQEGHNTNQVFDQYTWKNFQVFNRAYAEAVQPHLTSKALVWVHDFYLLLVPRYLTIHNPNAGVAFFLHSAFPSSEVLQCIPSREEILSSMLSCKVITFQTFEYARHFLSCCEYLLNTRRYFAAGGVLCIGHGERSVVIACDHFVLPYAQILSRLPTESVRLQAKKMRDLFGEERTILGSIDGDEPFSGLILKLRAFEKFLSECPQHQRHVGLLQHVLAKRLADSDESEIMCEVKRMAEDINKTYGTGSQKPIVVISEGNLDVDERLGLLQAVDILLDTSINDGLNLNPFLFCAAHSADLRGSMIVSEFSGCSSVLTGAIKVNPWNHSAVMETMHKVVTLDDHERKLAFQKDSSYVSTQRLDQWVISNLSELKRAHSVESAKPLRGLGAGHEFLEQVSPLSIDALVRDYRKAKTRAIFLDCEGTLAPDLRSALRPYCAQEDLGREGRPLEPTVLDCLRSLADDRANTVVVVSGRDPTVLDSWFGDVDGLGLCAEHGYYWVLPGKLQGRVGAERWQCAKENTAEDDDWKTIVFELMKQYVKRVQGSLVEYKGSAITWNYRKVGAQMLAKEMALELSRFLDPLNQEDGLLDGYPVTVVCGKGYVEVKRNDVDKGVAVKRMLMEMRNQLGEIDFILCIGDDRSDEDMFEVVNALAKAKEVESAEASDDGLASPKSRKSTTSGEWPPSAGGSTTKSDMMKKKGSLTFEDYSAVQQEQRNHYYSITVGRKASKAGFYLNNVTEVSELLKKLASQAIVTRFSRFASMPMLARQGPLEDEDSA